MLVALALLVALFQALLVYAQSPFENVTVPLAVKTPYLNGWTFTYPGLLPSLRANPNTFLATHSLGWVGYIRVDDQPHQWMGHDGFANFSNMVTSDITPTKSVFTLEAGQIQFNVTFFTPVEPNDYVRQSMPFSYMYIDAFFSNDSKPHSVQLYSDITAEWVTQDVSSKVVWDTMENSDIIYHNVTRANPQFMVDNNNLAEDGTLYYATLKRSNLTWQTCASNDCRDWFTKSGSLNNTKDTNFRAVNGTAQGGLPVYAFSVDLGEISPGSPPDPVISAIGLVRDPVVRYTTESFVQNRSGYYTTEYPTSEAAITAFLQDFTDAQSRNSQLEEKIMVPATEISSHYAQVLAFMTRQIFASMDITVPSNSDGAFNSSDVRIFMKDMGRSGRANPVDAIYGAFPALLFFNSSIARGLLEPLLESQSSPGYPNQYATPDLGSKYPNVPGNLIADNTLAVDSSSSLLVMAYAHAVKSGDISLLDRYYHTLERWADYLVFNALHPPQGSITKDLSTSSVNLSNEGLKGILGIYCMGKINDALGVANSTYEDQANSLIKDWKQLAIFGNHIGTVYGEASSWGLIYNLFPVVWLDIDLIEEDIINNQAQFYAQQTPGTYGFSLDSTQPDDFTFPHWTMWTAASIPQNMTSIRDNLIGFVHQRLTDMTKQFTLPMFYSATTGASARGLAGSAIHGAAFSILALSLPNVNLTIVKTKDAKQARASVNNNIGAIVGGLLGGIAGLLIVAFAILFFRRHRNKGQDKTNNSAIKSSRLRPHPFNLSTYSARNDDSNRQLTNIVNTHRGQGTWTQEGMAKQPRSKGDPNVQVINLQARSPQPGVVPPMNMRGGETSCVRVHQDDTPRISIPPPTTAQANGTAEELRAEMEKLRREIVTIRHIAAPPGYT